MERSEDACAAATYSRIMQRCGQSCHANAITHTLWRANNKTSQPGQQLRKHAFVASTRMQHWMAAGCARPNKQRALYAYLISMKCTLSSKYAWVLAR